MSRKIGLRKCVHCGKLVRGRGSVCPKCGKNVDRTIIPETKPINRKGEYQRKEKPMKAKTKSDDCPLAPVGNYWQGYPDEEGHPVRTVLYVSPCRHWDRATGICHWFDPPRKVS